MVSTWLSCDWILPSQMRAYNNAVRVFLVTKDWALVHFLLFKMHMHSSACRRGPSFQLRMAAYTTDFIPYTNFLPGFNLNLFGEPPITTPQTAW